jgi:hypothetical protein
MARRTRGRAVAGPYYHVVFTLPALVADIAYQNKAVIYDLLFKAVAETLITIAADPKHLGARIGMTAVLHTWGSALTHHPHVHMIVPGGGISLDGERWISCRPGFFLPVRVLSRLFRRLFLEMLIREPLTLPEVTSPDSITSSACVSKLAGTVTIIGRKNGGEFSGDGHSGRPASFSPQRYRSTNSALRYGRGDFPMCDMVNPGATATEVLALEQ